MSLKPLIALTVIHQSLTPGVAGDLQKGRAEKPPVSRVVEPFKKTGLAFLATDEDQQDEMLKLGCVEFAPTGTPLDAESEDSKAKAKAKAPAKDKAPAKKAAAADEGTGEGTGEGAGEGDDGEADLV